MLRRLAPLALFIVAGCGDGTAAGPAPQFDTSQPPPPPLEVSADGETTTDTETSTSTASAGTTSDGAAVASTGVGRRFSFNARYFFNKPETHGYIDLTPTQPEGTFTTQSATVSYNKGAISGQGFGVVTYTDGVLTIDLTRVRTAFFNSSCDQGCASFYVDDATFTDNFGNTETVDVNVWVNSKDRIIIDG